MTHRYDAPGVYVPDNSALDEALNSSGGRGFRLDHARLLLHIISVKRWLGNVDADGFARLNAGILRKWIQPRAYGPLKRLLMDCGVLVTDHHSAGRRATGFRIAERFVGPPRRHAVDYTPLAEKLLAWRTAFKTTRNPAEVEEIINRRRPMLNHLL